MPLYEYECESCANRFERIQKFSDPLVDTCPTCGGVVRKLLSSPAIQFKGSGWYITDYAKKGGDAGRKKEDAKKEDGKKEDGANKEKSTSKSDSGTSGDSASTSSTPPTTKSD